MPVSCCCKQVTPPSPPCNACSAGVSPATVLVVISGLTLCSGCINDSVGFDHKITSGSFSDGSYCCTYDASISTPNTICGYTYTLPTPVQISFYATADGSCGGAVTVVISITTIQVEFSTGALGSYKFRVFAGAARSGAFYYSLFAYSNTSSPNCVNGTFSNFFGDCSTRILVTPVSYSPIGFGGTISVVLNGC